MGPGSLRGSIFTFMSAAIGPGALLLPYTFKLIGIPTGLLIVIAGAYCSAQSLRFIITIAHVTGRDSYPAGVAAILGPMAGSLLSFIVGVVLIFATGSHLKFLSAMMPHSLPPPLPQMTLPGNIVAIAAVFPLCVSKSITSLRHFTVVAPLSLLYVIALIIVRGLMVQPPASPKAERHILQLLRFGHGTIWDLPQAWVVVLNAITCSHVAVPVYRQLHRAKAQRVNKVVLRSSTCLALLLSLVGISGVLTHGSSTPENVLLAYPADDRGAKIGQLLVTATLFVSLPFGLHALRDQVLDLFSKSTAEKIKDSFALRSVLTGILLGVPSVICVIFPSISSIIGMACGFGLVTYMFVVPVIAMCALRWPKKQQSYINSGVMKESSRESFHDLVLSSPLSEPLLGHQGSVKAKPGSKSPTRSPARSQGLKSADRSGPVNLTLRGLEPGDNFDVPSHPSFPKMARTGSSSPAYSMAGSEDGDAYLAQLAWTDEFLLSLVALVIASVVGFAAGIRATMQLINSEPRI